MESKTALIMANGTLVNTLKALQRNIKNDNDFKQLVEYFLDGNLKDWLNERYGYEKEIKALEKVDKNDPDFACQLCKAIGIDYTPSEPVNVALIEHEIKIRKALEKVTSDDSELIEELIANAGCTASNRSELDFLIKNGKKIIYLWGDSFKLPLEHNISYIGILGKPSVDIDLVDLDSLKSYGIKFENLNLPEAIRKAEEEVIKRITEEARIKAKEEAIKRKELERKEIFKNAKIGDYIKFGRYSQTANGEFKPIECQVLAKKENKMLVVSRYGLDAKRFDYDLDDDRTFCFRHSGRPIWAYSKIRKWLNGEFYKKAFSESDKKYINLSYLFCVGTSDYVFLLSKKEAEKYFANKNLRRCKPTEYAVKNGADVDSDTGCSWWWLRSRAIGDCYNVFSDGSINECGVLNTCIVRPALWINISCDQKILDWKDDLSEQLPNYNNQPKKQNSVNPNPFKKAKGGDVVKFGNYPQTANGDNQPIEWQVLEKKKNKMLVISRYILERKCFDRSSNDWENSDIREWLNIDFYNKAFNEKEKKYIKFFDPFVGSRGDCNYIFLLSKEEAEEYFANDDARKCKPTEYAMKHGVSVYGCGYSYWRLRSEDYNSNRYVYLVHWDGHVYCGGFFSFCAVDFLIGIRPALWINS